MRAYRFTPTASAALDQQIDYLIDRGALQAARNLEQRLRTYIADTLCLFPFAGTFIPERQIYESWVPGTKLVLWYSISDDAVTIAMVWHAAQLRLRDDEAD